MRSLGQEYQNFKIFIDFLPIAICTVNKDAKVTYTNKVFEKTFFKTCHKEEKEGMGDLLSCINSMLSPNGCGSGEQCRRCQMNHALKAALEGKKSDNSLEIPFTLLRDGNEEKRWFQIYIMTEMLEKEGLLLIGLNDITFYKKNSLKLLQSKKIGEEANKAKSMFLANMSHEIRTPLNGLIGMLELTLLTKLQEEQRENLEVARNCANTLLVLINDILDISKVENDKVELEEVRFDIRELIQKVKDVHIAKVIEKDLKLECIVEEAVPPYILGDSFRLQQVLNNLLSNAIKFTEHGFVRLEVKVLCKSNDSYTITFAVEDSGIGLCQKDMKYLFQLFSQVDGSFTRRYGGSGLGLVISQKLVNLMGGEIKVKSQQDKGSVFYFTIQMKTVDELEAEEKPVSCIAELERPERILLVEDDKANQMVTKKMLHTLGYRKIAIADNGYQALRLLERDTYDIVLMDIQLPELDGMETTQIIREGEKKSGKHIPIIAITAHALKGDKEKFLNRGMDGYVSKPIAMLALKEALGDFLGKGQEINKEHELKAAYAAWSHAEPQEEEDNPVSNSDNRLFKTILKELQEKKSLKDKDKNSYIQMEKLAHELKIRAKRKGYKEIGTSAFRMELAIRKMDDASIERLHRELEAMLNKQRWTRKEYTK